MTISRNQKPEIRGQNQKLSSSSKSSGKEPTTMEELLKQTGYTPHGLKKGQEVQGTIVSITPKEILVDIAGKTEGVVLEKDKKLYNELLSRFSLGDKVNAIVISPESDYGHAVLSLRRELMDKSWSTLFSKKEKAETIEVLAVDQTRGGLLVDVFGLRGFIPLSQLELYDKPESIIGTQLKAKILELDRKERRIVLSQKDTRIDPKKTRKLLDKVEIGKEYKGVVSGITNFGIFVKIPAEPSKPEGDVVEGLVHISEISWEKVEDIDKLFKLGDIVSVLVVGVDKENLKLNLSLKKLSADPWEEVAKKFAKGETVRGRATRISPVGVFVGLSEGIEGLIHKSKVPPGRELAVGDSIECIVESVDSEKRRIALAPLMKEKPVGYR